MDASLGAADIIARGSYRMGACTTSKDYHMNSKTYWINKDLIIPEY